MPPASVSCEALEALILESPDNFAQIGGLFEAAQESGKGADHQRGALKSLHRVFSVYRRRYAIQVPKAEARLRRQKRDAKRRRLTAKEKGGDGGGEGQGGVRDSGGITSSFVDVLVANHEVFLEVLVQMLASSHPKVQAVSLNLLTENLREEALLSQDFRRRQEEKGRLLGGMNLDSDGEKEEGEEGGGSMRQTEVFPLESLKWILGRVVGGVPALSDQVLQCLGATAGEYGDFRLHALSALLTPLEWCRQSLATGGSKEDHGGRKQKGEKSKGVGGGKKRSHEADREETGGVKADSATSSVSSGSLQIPVDEALHRALEFLLSMPLPETTTHKVTVKTDTLERRYNEKKVKVKEQKVEKKGPPAASLPLFVSSTSKDDQKKKKKSREIEDTQTGEMSLEQRAEAKARDPAKFRYAFQQAWLALLRLPLRLNDSKRAMHLVPLSVLPFLSNPLALSDFYLNAFDSGFRHADRQLLIGAEHFHMEEVEGGAEEELSSSSSAQSAAAGTELCVLALAGLFQLMSRFKLGEPATVSSNAGSFYERLFGLLRPETLSLPPDIRSRFLRLLNLSLRSPLLPSTHAAAFAKRLARLAALLPSGGAVWVLGALQRLVHKQKTACRRQIHIPPDAAALVVFPRGDPTDLSSLSAASSSSSSSNRYSDKPLLSSVLSETDLERLEGLTEKERARLEDAWKVCALSLWELKFFKRHFHPSVSQMANAFSNENLFKVTAERLVLEFEEAGEGATGIGAFVRQEMKHKINVPEIPAAFTPPQVPDDSKRLADLAACF
uniref:CCAAT-binding factor domain-containing protein n=1 Tax=Chromera velia CCMP2878 TaxID=1169474 RepID=A0A0G4HAB1_9ALVE|eukprot:Cvel_25490.t1-p1 / transcript=Cvel_25490.t1 / gene=Cvel_25490 / organism=Chromera_velia_CCMP2878 / gene_product=hypothetical protein / transcript_product=hypothetical protein / location=Cvel_scaffold2896:7158-13529(-) / protein_length=784 / sequence_SO=supercontig / SO=protein_coding / is_pseudo=false